MKRFLLVMAFLLFSNVTRAEVKQPRDYTVSEVYAMLSMSSKYPDSIDHEHVYFVNYYSGFRDGVGLMFFKENIEAYTCINDKPLIFWIDRVMDEFKDGKIGGQERFNAYFFAKMFEVCNITL